MDRRDVEPARRLLARLAGLRKLLRRAARVPLRAPCGHRLRGHRETREREAHVHRPRQSQRAHARRAAALAPAAPHFRQQHVRPVPRERARYRDQRDLRDHVTGAAAHVSGADEAARADALIPQPARARAHDCRGRLRDGLRSGASQSADAHRERREASRRHRAPASVAAAEPLARRERRGSGRRERTHSTLASDASGRALPLVRAAARTRLALEIA
jgi:hypothetical protein